MIAECKSNEVTPALEISYHAVEIDSKGRALCVEQVGLHYPNALDRVFEQTEAAFFKLGQTMDVVVMVNVLHEIDPCHWLRDVFGAKGIGTLLRPGGKLIVVEDTQLPRGELAHSAGFLVLEHAPLLQLFGVSNSSHPSVRILGSPNYGTRLQATEIDASLLAAVTPATIIAAIRTQQKMSMAQVRTLRSAGDKPNYDTGRIHAYHAQVLANTMLALDALETEGRAVDTGCES